jgi:hypothetical protein
MTNNIRAFLNGALGDHLIQAAIQRAYDALLRRRAWNSCRAIAPMVTLAPYSTGTVSVNSGSKTVTGSGTSWTSSYEEAYIRFGSEKNFYKITTVGSSTSITLETAYAGASDLSDEDYEIFKHIYQAPSDARVIDGVMYDAWLHSTSVARINRANSDRTMQGPPEAWAPAGHDSSGVLLIEIHPVPGDEYQLMVSYQKPRVTTLGSSDTALLPETLIEAHALLWCYRMLAEKDQAWNVLAQQQAQIAEKLTIEAEMEDADLQADEDAAINWYSLETYDRGEDTYTEDLIE